MKSKIRKIFLNESGSFLGTSRGCLVVKNRQGKVEKFPLFENEIGEIQVRMGNLISSGALATCAFWRIPVVFLTARGNPVAVLKSLEDDSHVKTRICQYESLKDGRAFEIAKQFVKGKIEGQNNVLKKYGLRTDTSARLKVDAVDTDDLALLRKRLMQIEAKFSQFYFNQIFKMFPKVVLIDRRRTYKAYDGINNLFNLAYSVLKWKTHVAITRAKLEPFLGFLHSEQFGKPSLVCDLMEFYRPLVDDFIIQYSKNLCKKDFVMKQEAFSSNRKGMRQFLNKSLTKDLIKKLNAFFEEKVEIPRVKHGNRQELETLIGEEAQQLAKFLRGEKKDWVPRIPALGNYRLGQP